LKSLPYLVSLATVGPYGVGDEPADTGRAILWSYLPFFGDFDESIWFRWKFAESIGLRLFWLT